MTHVLCPPIPGAFSALGLVATDLKRDYVRTFFTRTDQASTEDLTQAFAEIEAEGAAMLERAGVPPDRQRFERTVDARYGRQSYELVVPVPDPPYGADVMDQIAQGFHDRHAQTYGHDNRSEPVQLVNVRLSAIGEIPPVAIRQAPEAASAPTPRQRAVWLRGRGEEQAQVLDRATLPSGFSAEGPAVIEALESTVFVPPEWRAEMDEAGYLHLRKGETS